MKKWVLKTAAAGLLLALLSSIPAYAAGWKEEGGRWRWQKEDQSFAASEWQWLDGNSDGTAECYYFDGSGYLVTGTTTPDGCTVNEQGAWTENGVVRTRASVQALADGGSPFLEDSIKTAANGNMKYYLYTPKNATENMPLIVYLHSAVPRGKKLEAVKTEDMVEYLLNGGKDSVPAYVLIPHLASKDKGWAKYKDSVRQLINQVADEYKIDRKRISIAGWSMGATAIPKIVGACPELFSGAVILSGYPSEKMQPEDVDVMKDIPVWFLYESEVELRKDAKSNSLAAGYAINNAGGSAIMTEVPGVNHETFRAFPEGKTDPYGVMDWLISQSRK